MLSDECPKRFGRRGRGALLTALAIGFASFYAPPLTAQQEKLQYSIGVLRQLPEPPAWETAFTRPPEDEGIAGARLAIEDNSTTGAFLNQEFSLTEEVIGPDDDPMEAFERLVGADVGYLLLDVPAEQMTAIADAAPEEMLLFNAGAHEDRLRNEDCRLNLFHSAPSHSMLTDALAQYMVTKRWTNWLLIEGTRPGDKLYADALRRSAEKFGIRIVDERVWDFGPDTRRQAQAEVPVFTQGVDYDIAVIADELGEFGDLILYRTWDPRPTAGTQGLSPTAWHPAIEAWGAVQLQNRFIRLADRRMGALDYQFWVAARAIGEAATIVNDDHTAAIRERLMSDDFTMAAFKGVPLSFRHWDRQLRQPIPLAHPASLVSTSPQEGFLHQSTPLDSLGRDAPETGCQHPG